MMFHTKEKKVTLLRPYSLAWIIFLQHNEDEVHGNDTAREAAQPPLRRPRAATCRLPFAGDTTGAARKRWVHELLRKWNSYEGLDSRSGSFSVKIICLERRSCNQTFWSQQENAGRVWAWEKARAWELARATPSPPCRAAMPRPLGLRRTQRGRCPSDCSFHRSRMQSMEEVFSLTVNREIAGNVRATKDLKTGPSVTWSHGHLQQTF